MIQKFEKHIHTNFPFVRDSKLLLAISGGLDSVVLMYLCNQLKLNISLAHCNFKLRNEESDLDEEFVKKIAQISSNQIFTTFFHTEKFRNNKNLPFKLQQENCAITGFKNWF